MEIIKDIEKLTTIRKFKKVMIDLFKGYPTHAYFGIFEAHFGLETGKLMVKIADRDGLILIIPPTDKTPEMYRLTPLGINFAVSMINLDYSERLIKYSELMRKYTIAIIFIGLFTLGIGIYQLIY